MRFLRVGPVGAERPAVLDTDDQAYDLSSLTGDIDAGFLASDGPRRARAALAAGDLAALDTTGLRIAAPVARPGKIVCIGLNYRDHAAETGAELPAEPVVFMKAANTSAHRRRGRGGDRAARPPASRAESGVIAQRVPLAAELAQTKEPRHVRIDAHHHLWQLSRRPQTWLDAPELAVIRRDFALSELAPRAQAEGIEGTVLVQVLPDLTETREFLALAATEPLVAGVVGWADLTAPRIADTLAELRAGAGGDRLVGVRHLVQGEPDPAWLARTDVRRGLRAVGHADLAYDLLTLPHQLPAAIDTVRALPDQRFVLDHLSKPPIARGEREPWAGLLRELAREPNVFCKLSGLVTEADPDAWTVADLRPYAETALDAFGPERVMFGSDWPVCLVAATYEQVMRTAEDLTESLQPHERASVFGGTAARVYGLPHESKSAGTAKGSA